MGMAGHALMGEFIIFGGLLDEAVKRLLGREMNEERNGRVREFNPLPRIVAQ
jgi:hypothetical protein